MARGFEESKVFELLGSVRKVTLLEVLRLAMDLDKPAFCRELELRCGGSLHRRTLGGWEARRHKPGKHADKLLRIFFEIAAIVMLGLGSRDAARYWTWMTPEEIVEEMLHRRKMLRSMSIAGVAGAAGLFLPVPDLVADAQDLDRLGRVGVGAVADAKKTATKLAIAYRANPDADAVRAAKAHAYTLLDLLRRPGNVGDTVRPRLQSVASDAAALAGTGILIHGDLDEAGRWFTTALDLARAAGDRRLEAHALAAFAGMAWTRAVPDHAAAVAALRAAARLQGCLPPAGRAVVFGNLGCELAALGDDLASGRFLEEARYAAALIPLDEPGWGWWSVHGRLAGWEDLESEVHTAGRSMWLGRPAEAIEVFSTAIKTGGPVGRAFLHHHLTNSYVALRDLEGACNSAMAGLQVARTYELKAIPPKIREARRAFPPQWNGAIALVRQLDELLALAG